MLLMLPKPKSNDHAESRVMRRLLDLKLIARHGTRYLLALAISACIWIAYRADSEPICQRQPVYETVKDVIIIRPGYALTTKNRIGPVRTGRRINYDVLVCPVDSNGLGIPASIAVQPHYTALISG
jgi:hypothetical protein